MPQHLQPIHRVQWTATSRNGIDFEAFTVTGVFQAPTPGYKLTLTPVTVAGSDPTSLLLVLTVVPPTGIEPQHVTPTTVEFAETFVVTDRRVRPTTVTIFEATTHLEFTPISGQN